MSNIDLHMHTTASDGSVLPEEMPIMAKAYGLSAIAITDHDTVEGFAAAKAAGDRAGIEVIPGIEFGTKYKSSVHILGYFIDTENAALIDELQFIVFDRDNRNLAVIHKMQNDGIDVDYIEMKKRFGKVIGRPHIAQILIEAGLAESTQDAFAHLVGKGMRYYMPRETMPIERCIELIKNAGGLAVLAHPYEYKDDVDDLITHCIDLGIDGIECRHSSHNRKQMAYLEQFADEHGLLKTGGSDFHGYDVKPDISPGTGKGQVSVPYEWLDKLKERIS